MIFEYEIILHLADGQKFTLKRTASSDYEILAGISEDIKDKKVLIENNSIINLAQVVYAEIK